MREATNQLQQSAEAALAKILDKMQYPRLKQIQLQLAGVPALLRPDMIEKLQINEDQVAQIQEVLNEGRQVQRQSQRAWGEMMRTALPADPNGGQNGGNGGGQNGGPGGRGGRGPNFRDPAVRSAMQTFMEKPETKAQLDQMKVQNNKLQNQIVASVYRALTKKQGAAYKKMLGAPFDPTKLQGGQGGANGGTAQASASNDEEEKPQTKTAAPAAKAKSAAPAKATAKRKSLRELRGLDQ
jgi:hypothetical protein